MTRNLDLVIFDWNGTLIDDVWLSVNALNGIMEKRRLKPLTTEFYREHFCFPAVNFYREISLDVNNDWDDIVKEFTENYENGIDKVKLFPDVVPVLDELKRSGLKLGILSVMEHNTLNRHVKALRIAQYFDFIQGTEDFSGGTKTHLCKKILAQSGVEKERILFVGDTYHDYETAVEIGCRAALISRGHNTAEKLRISGASIFPSLRNLADTLKSEI